MRRSMLTIGTLVSFLLAVLASLLIGQQSLTWEQIFSLIQGSATPITHLLFWDFRLPRTLVAIVGGGALAASGFLLQGVTRNDLADSGILGVNSGISLAVMIYLGFFPQGTAYHLPICGFLGGLLAAITVYIISYQKGRALSMNKLLLAGVAVNAGVNALTVLVTIKLSKDSFNFVGSFLSGSIWGASWPQVMVLALWTAVFLLAAVVKVPYIRLLGLGEEQAISIGVKVSRERFWLLLLAVLLAAGAVAFTGSLAFVGLLAPHIAKQLTKQEDRQTFAFSVIFGGILVLVGDTLGRSLLSSGEVPAGIMIALIGAPYFLYLILKRK